MQRLFLYYRLVSRRSLISEARVPPQAPPGRIYGEQSNSGTGYGPSIAAVPCQYHSTNSPYALSHVPPK
jgi:hypothetical protein